MSGWSQERIDAAMGDNTAQPILFGYRQIAAYMGVSHMTVSRMYRSGVLPLVKIGRHRIMVTKSTLNNWMLAALHASENKRKQS